MNTPEDRKGKVEANNSAETGEVEERRGELVQNFETPQLSSELRNRLSDLKPGEEKKAIIAACNNIDHFLAKVSKVPKFEAEAKVLSDKVKELMGDDLYEKTSAALEELSDMIQGIIERTSNPQNTEYLLNVDEDSEGTLIADTGTAYSKMQAGRPACKEIKKHPGVLPEFDKLGGKIVALMDEGKTQVMALYEVQRELEEEIKAEIENGNLNEDTAKLILIATVMQLEQLSNSIGQKSTLMEYREGVEDFGDTKEERLEVLIGDYTQNALSAAEGLKFLEPFFKRV